MKTKKRRLLILLLTTLIALSASGCVKSESAAQNSSEISNAYKDNEKDKAPETTASAAADETDEESSANTKEGSEEEVAASSEDETSSADESQAPEVTPCEVDISDNLFDFQIAINDEVYSLPTTVDAFTDNGWEFSSNPDEIVEAGYYLIGQSLDKGDLHISVQLVNDSDEDMKAIDCVVGNIIVTNNSPRFGCSTAYVQIANGIVLNQSTTDEARAALGEPTSENETDYSTTLYYDNEEANYSSVSLQFNADGILENITIYNYGL